MPGNESGIALVVVLWSIVLLSSMALASVSTQRTELQQVRNLLTAAQVRAYAQAGVHYALSRLSSGSVSERLQPGDPPLILHFDGVEILVTVADERSKIDLNAAPPELLEGLLLALEFPEQRAAQLKDAILDWRDSNNLREYEGAEDDDYRAQGLEYGAKDQEFDSIGELLMVQGVTHGDFDLLRPHLTVFSKEGRIAAQSADALVLQALPGMTAEILENFIIDRQESLLAGTPITLPRFAGTRFMATGNPSVVRIRCDVTMTNGVTYTSGAISNATSSARGNPIIAWLGGAAFPANPVGFEE